MEDYKISPDVDQSCVFPSNNDGMKWDFCRRIEDWEETGINDTYRVIFYNSRLKIMLAFSLYAQPKLMMRDWRCFIDGVGVVKVVHWSASTGVCGELTRLSPSQHTPSLTRTSTS